MMPGQRRVICAWCGNRYRSVWGDEADDPLRQGSHCASDVVFQDGAWLVRGAYGSDEHDLHCYRFVANAPTAPADPVCDECISERLLAGDLEEIGPDVKPRPGAFAPRPYGTWILVHRIRILLEEAAGMRRVVEAARQMHSAGSGHDPACVVCMAVARLARYEQWNTQPDDGSDPLLQDEGQRELASQFRDVAKYLSGMASFCDGNQGRPTHMPTKDNPGGRCDRYPECEHCGPPRM